MQHLLIVGSPRSGTSLLTWLLGSQDGIAISSEVKGKAWYRVVGHETVGVKLCVPEQIRLQPQSRLTRNFKRLEKNLFRPLHAVFGPPFHRPHLPGKMSITDFMEFEDPLVVGVFRDPHEVTESIMSRGKQPKWVAHATYADAIESIHGAWSENRDRVQLVDFDQLIADPETVVQSLCQSLGVPFDRERLSGYTKNYRRGDIDVNKKGGRSHASRLDHAVFRKRPDVAARYSELIESVSSRAE